MTEACPSQILSLQTFMPGNNHAHEWSYCFPADWAGLGPVPGCTGDENVGNQHNRGTGQSEGLVLREEGQIAFAGPNSVQQGSYAKLTKIKINIHLKIISFSHLKIINQREMIK